MQRNMRVNKHWNKKFGMFDLVNTTILLLFSIICLYPFLNILALSFNTGLDSMRGGITVIPRELTFANFIVVFRNGLVLNAYKVTIARTIIGTVTMLSVTAMVAYGLSEPALPFKKSIMIYILITMLFSGGLIPLYLVLRGLKLTNTFSVFIVPGMFSAWTCMVMKSSFQQIPISLKEAMRIDGGNEFDILRHIVIPVSMPMFAALALFSAVGHWNDWFSGAYFVRSNNLMPVQTYLMHIMSTDVSSLAEKMSLGTATTANVSADALSSGGISKVTSMSLKMAIVVIGTAPILLVYPFVQRFFVKGVLIGSLKE